MGFYRPIAAGPPRASLCRARAGTVANEVRSLDILLVPADFGGLCAINAVVDGDDRRADIDCVALVHQQLGDSTGVRTGKFNQRLAGLDLDQNVIDLDFITDANSPCDDVGFDQTLTRIGQPESLQRHYTPSVGLRAIYHVQYPIKIRKVLLLDPARRIWRIEAGNP